MKKAMYKRRCHPALEPSETMIGFDMEKLWKSVKYFGGPKKSGRYLTINKLGRIMMLSFTGTHDVDRRLFEKVANSNYAYKDDRPVTDEDCMDIYRCPWNIWYYEGSENNDYVPDINILTTDNDSYPLYFYDLDLDSRIDMDANEEPAEAKGDPVYYAFMGDGEFVKKEDDKA